MGVGIGRGFSTLLLRALSCQYEAKQKVAWNNTEVIWFLLPMLSNSSEIANWLTALIMRYYLERGSYLTGAPHLGFEAFHRLYLTYMNALILGGLIHLFHKPKLQLPSLSLKTAQAASKKLWQTLPTVSFSCSFPFPP